jgi:two-component system nitrogen regulation response regulator GlnG
MLVIDDEPFTLECFRFLFPSQEVTVHTSVSAREGLAQYSEHRPDVVVLDIHLPDMPGLEAFRRIREIDAKVPVILVTGRGTANTAIEAIKLGAYEYVVKPLDPNELRELISRAFEISRLMRVPAKVADLGPADDNSDMLVGNCAAMQKVYKAIGRVAPQDVTALILGESGTGKELVARAIYHYSSRSSGPFLAINCAAIPETLLESELFGHERGAFTGADRRRIGKFEQCDGGTLFLDEIGDMAPLTQAKILRVLQEKQFERMGSNELINTDVRIIAATNRNLEEMIASGQFRADLYYRLNVYTLSLPPLRERGDDIRLLAEHFLRRFSRELRKQVSQIPPETLAALVRYSWPGNVREFQSVLKQGILQATGPVLLPDFLPKIIRGNATSNGASNSTEKPRSSDLGKMIEDHLIAGTANLYSEVLASIERELFLRVLRHTNHNLSQTARILGISRPTLRSKLAALGIAIDRSTSIEDEG